jgi:hypothetical protein
MKKYQFQVVNQVGITFGVTEGDGLWRAKIVNKIVTVAFAIMLRLRVGIAGGRCDRPDHEYREGRER